ncbi:saccharopine dehydrogenase family protein [Microlunatus soli]|uniref:Uncharacterized conserved protein n=1 Tax=Microlunatus soli TaxID=630515 RepID=A0A1H1SZ11_9ACTN|nr:saccharopine dehydrogenase NADP-binding domain-containing protein [Microlunatus soli]SDS53161.1 Uncharacterized conserved protein [Microlunatus soli]
MNTEVWILGSTGRVGRAVAARLTDSGVPVVLCGRDSERLARLSSQLGNPSRVVAGSLTEVLAGLGQQAPAAVVNTVGPFPETAPQVLAACSPTTHYVDVANEPSAVSAVLDRDPAEDATRTVVTGAGFGVLGTESIAGRVCADRPPAASLRVDAIASVEGEAGRFGTALARSLLESIVLGGHQVEDGRLVPARFGDHPIELVTPDGDTVRTAGMPSGELIAAWRLSGARSVLAASNMAPSTLPVRIALRVGTALLQIPPVARFAVARLAAVRMPARPRPREHSWARARAQWADGEVREGWLRAPEGMAFTSAIIAEVVRRCVAGDSKPGAYTPVAAFGPELAEAAGAEFIFSESVGR